MIGGATSGAGRVLDRSLFLSGGERSFGEYMEVDSLR